MICLSIFLIHKAFQRCKTRGDAFYADGQHLNADGMAHICSAFAADVLAGAVPYETALVPIIRFYG